MISLIAVLSIIIPVQGATYTVSGVTYGDDPTQGLRLAWSVKYDRTNSYVKILKVVFQVTGEYLSGLVPTTVEGVYSVKVISGSQVIYSAYDQETVSLIPYQVYPGAYVYLFDFGTQDYYPNTYGSRLKVELSFQATVNIEGGNTHTMTASTSRYFSSGPIYN